LIKEKKIGSIILMNSNIKGKDVHALINSLQGLATSSSQQNLLITIDQEGGIVSRINNPNLDLTSQTKIKDYNQAYEVSSKRAKELSLLGINVNFSPVLDYINNPSSFLYNRVFRGTKEQVSSLGIAMVKGYQDNGISATVKHFPGHDNNSVDSHRSLPVSSIKENDLLEYIEVFRNVIKESKPYMVMTSHVLFPKIDAKYPATLSPKIISVLRNDLLYNGVIITDDMNMGAITTKFGIKKAAKQAVLAGNDILLYVANEKIINEAYNEIIDSVNNGQIPMDNINNSVYRILSLKKILSK
jgi:beta-N-acetylhexosaminidase